MTTQEIVEEMGRMFEQSGVNPILGRIFGVLFTSDTAVNLVQIAERLKLSKAAVSINIRILREMGYCRKLPTSADRQHYYELYEDYLVRAYRMRVDRQRQYIASLRRLQNGSSQPSETIEKRLAELTAFQDFLIDAQDRGIGEWESLQQEREENGK